MPATIASSVAGDQGPQVPLSFSNQFWGLEERGPDVLISRMQDANTTCNELKTFYNARRALEEEYAHKLFSLARKPLGSTELGTLRASLDVARGETEQMGKQHKLIAEQMKQELEEPLNSFAGGMKERRKIVQNGIERLLKTKIAQTKSVTGSRDKFEQDCLRIKGYLAQGHMVMGQEERKNKAKLEKTQINMAANSNDYESAVKVLEETVGRWNKEWKAACDKFQDLEEERLDFMKSSLWAFANIASTVCVSDDASCEKIRLSLENCEVEKDIIGFIKSYGTGQEIPDPPKYINFCRGDVDSASEVSEDENYAVAQFQRTTNPAFRSSSPNHSTSGSQHPQSELAQRMHGDLDDEDDEPTPSKANSGRPPPLNYRPQEPNVPPNYSPSQHGEIAPPTQIPHNEYPHEGMTMFVRNGAPSVAGSALTSNTRPSSRDSQSDYSNPTSYTSADPMSRNASPTKAPPVNGVGMPGMTKMSPEKAIQKKRSGFFSNSPFRRKSKKEVENPVSNRHTFNITSASRVPNFNASEISNTSTQSSPVRPTQSRQGQNLFNRPNTSNANRVDSEEPVDPRASFQLNVGNNVFDVASPDNASSQSTPRANGRKGFTISNPADDPIAQALADLKQNSTTGLGMGKQASMRVAADRYMGVKTPAPDSTALSRPSAISAASADRLRGQGSTATPPPAYDAPPSSRGGGSALGVPQPAFTSKEMRKRTDEWGGSQAPSASTYAPRPASSNGNRSRSPAPVQMRGASPQPQYQDRRARSPAPVQMRGASPQPQYQDRRARSPAPGQMRARSPAPPMNNPNMRARSPAPPDLRHGPSKGAAHFRATSPNPYPQVGRPGMEMQLSSQDVQRYDQGSGRSRQGMQSQRPNSAYGGDAYQDPRGRAPVDPQVRRERSKSMAAPARGPQPAFHARALYSYAAAIPEELSFSKGDVLAVLRLQDDGWWEAYVAQGKSASARPGLIPSECPLGVTSTRTLLTCAGNYCQKL
jgi:hypothetical protein